MIKSYLKSVCFLVLFLTAFTAKSGQIYKSMKHAIDANAFVGSEQSIFTPISVPNYELNKSVSAFKLFKVNTNTVGKIVNDKPKYISLVFPDPTSNGTIKVLLVKCDLYTSDFKISTSNSEPISKSNGVNYRGVIENDENSFAAVSIYSDEVMGLICDQRGNFNLGKLKNDINSTHIFYNDNSLLKTNPFVCSTTLDLKKSPNNLRSNGNSNSISTTNCVNFYWETDQDVFTDKGSSGAVSTYINGLFNQVSALYANDGLTAHLQTLYIWNTVDPYTGPASGDYLDQFGTSRTSFAGDLAHLIGYGGGGGVAYVDVLCETTTQFKMGYSGIYGTYNNIPTYSWSVEVISHEQGHNMGSEHTHDCVWNGNSTAIDGCGPASGYASSPGGCAQAVIPAKGTIMSYCHLSGGNGINLALGFGTQPLALITSRINGASCLAPCSAPGISNDDPCNATLLSVGTTCVQTTGNNTAATNSSVPATLCDGNGDGDIWFKAVVPSSGKIYINSFAGDLTDMGMAVYTGSCASLTLFNCYAGGNATTSTMPYAQINTGLSAGDTVWIRMWDVGNDEFGAFNICATNPCTLTTSITGPTTACTTPGASLCVPTATSYLWNTSATTNCISVTSSGTYSVIVTNSIGCTATASQTVTVNSNPSALITGPTTGCTGSTVQLCGNTGTFTYLWSNSATTQCINVNSSGTYSVTITNGQGCTSTDSHTVTFGSSLTVAITGPATTCSNSGDQFCADAGFTAYAWSTGATTQCITPATTGSYSVTVSDAGGCTATQSKSITVNTPTAMSISGPTSGCANSFPQLCAAGGFVSYAWSNGSTTQCIAPSTSGTYTVTGTDANGCTATSSQTISIFTNPTVNITGPSIVCPGTTAQLCAVTGAGTYLWSNNASASCINVTDSATYSVTVTGPNGCTSTATHLLAKYAVTPAIITGPTEICFGSTAQLCAPAGFSTYQWSTSATTQCINASNTGSYSVQLTDPNGCTASASQTLTVGASLNVTISGPAGVCPGQTVQLCASATGTTSWSTGASTQCISPTTSGTYTVTVTDVDGCTGSASKTFTAYPAFSAAVSGPSTACYNSNPQLCAPNGTNYQYSWSSGETTRCITANSSGIYTVTITNANGCTATGSKGLTVFSQLNSTISGPTSLCTGAVGQLCAPTGSTLYQWSTGSTSRCITVNNSGTYTVTITDGNGCTASSSLPVTFSSSITTVITGSHTPCFGSTIELCVPAGYSDYTWNTGSTTECITVSSNGNYSVTIHDAIGCVGNDTHSVVFNSLPPVLIAGQTELCDGEVGILCATSGYPSYLWSDNSSQSCLSADTTGNYSVVITDASGCTNQATAHVNVTAINPTLVYNSPDLVASPAGLQYLYDWNYNGAPYAGACSTNVCTPDHTGNYTVIITDQLSGCIDSTTLYYFSVGIEENQLNQIRVYPNPISSDLLNLTFEYGGNEKISIQLTDAIGQILLQDIISKQGYLTKEIDFREFSAGIYFITLKGDKWSKTWKLIRQ